MILAAVAIAAAVEVDAPREELLAAMTRLQTAKTYRMKMGEQLIEYQNPEPRLRITEKTKVSGFEATRETIVVGKVMANRVISPELEAHIAKLKATKRVSALISLGTSIRSALQSMALGPFGWLSALSVARSAASAARDVSKPEPLEHYFRWECMELPIALTPQKNSEPDPSLRVTKVGTDNTGLTEYRSTSTFQGANGNPMTMNSRAWIDANEFPRKTELSFGGDDPPVVMEYYDFDAADIKVELPKCDEIEK